MHLDKKCLKNIGLIPEKGRTYEFAAVLIDLLFSRTRPLFQ